MRVKIVWNLDKKIEYLWWNILIYKDENRHSVLSFHPHIFFEPGA